MPVSINRGRRRRVVLDEVVQSECVVPAPAKPAPAPENDTPDDNVYSPRARRRFQLRTTDLIPKRAFTLAAIICVLLSAWLGIVLLDIHAPSWEAVIGSDGVEALTIGGRASLSVWFSAFILILTAIACLQVFLLRQHRRDDYRGVYRWWLWMAGILLLASLNNVVGVASIAKTALGHLIESSEYSAGWGWGIVKFGVLAALVGRFGYEMRVSRGALIGCSLIMAAYCGALVIESSSTVSQFANQYQVSFGNLILLGQIAVFTVVLVYSRFIYLEAHGLIKMVQPESKQRRTTKKSKASSKRRAETSKKKRDVEQDESEVDVKPSKVAARKSPKKSEVDGQPEEKSPRVSRKTKKQTVAEPAIQTQAMDSSQDAELDAEIESLEGKTLSKSERRRLKKLQRRQSRAA